MSGPQKAGEATKSIKHRRATIAMKGRRAWEAITGCQGKRKTANAWEPISLVQGAWQGHAISWVSQPTISDIWPWVNTLVPLVNIPYMTKGAFAGTFISPFFEWLVYILYYPCLLHTYFQPISAVLRSRSCFLDVIGNLCPSFIGNSLTFADHPPSIHRTCRTISLGSFIMQLTWPQC